MPNQFDCRTGDKGTCFIPDPALVLVGGRARTATRMDLQTFLGNRDAGPEGLQTATLVRPLAPDETELLMSGGTLEGRDGGGGDHGVIATCTCGHIYVIR